MRSVEVCNGDVLGELPEGALPMHDARVLARSLGRLQVLEEERFALSVDPEFVVLIWQSDRFAVGAGFAHPASVQKFDACHTRVLKVDLGLDPLG